MLEAENLIQPHAARADRKAFEAILDNVPDGKVQPDDEAKQQFIAAQLRGSKERGFKFLEELDSKDLSG